MTMDGKWLPDLKAHMSLVEAAQHVLAVRLGVVRDRLPQAMFVADKDVEHVHQLRVATRRAGAALRLFRCCLPEKDFKRVRRRLRELRRACGAARDWDVFLINLGPRLARARAEQRPGLNLLLGYGSGRRAAAQELLSPQGKKKPVAWEDLLHHTLRSLHHPAHDGSLHGLRDLARPQLTALVQELEEAVHRDLNEYEHLHRVRILGKRLRYAMEIFESCYGEAFKDEYYPAIETMQDILGDANDSHVASQRLTGILEQLKTLRPKGWERYQPGIAGLLRFHQRRLPQKRREFEQWWARWQESGAEAAFASLIT
jgi:CHAD domain-containing protein